MPSTAFPITFDLSKPGLFVTATDTEVGKTVVTCAIAAALRGGGARVGVCKPFASGCRKEREGLVNDDAEALAHFADCRQPLAVINPIRFAPPVAPAVAAEMRGESIDYGELSRCMTQLDRASDVMLVEGVGGLLVPLDPSDRKVTVLPMAVAMGYPVVVVARATLGTLNHTAMTVQLLKQAGCRVAGIVMNGYEPDAGKAAAKATSKAAAERDQSMATNRRWLEKLTRVSVLAVVPRAEGVAADKGHIPESVLDAVATVDWGSICGRRSTQRSG